MMLQLQQLQQQNAAFNSIFLILNSKWEKSRSFMKEFQPSMELFKKVSWGGLLGPPHPPRELGLRVVQQYLSGGPVPDTMTGFQEPLCKISHHYLKKK